MLDRRLHHVLIAGRPELIGDREALRLRFRDGSLTPAGRLKWVSPSEQRVWFAVVSNGTEKVDDVAKSCCADRRRDSEFPCRTSYKPPPYGR